MLNIPLKISSCFLPSPPLQWLCSRKIRMGWSGHGNCRPWEHTNAICSNSRTWFL